MNSKKSKKPYQKPKIEQVRLVPEEAVLGNCKFNNGALVQLAECAPEPCASTAGS